MATQIRPKDIFEANADLEERVGKLDVRISYDEEFDIFLIAFGRSTRAITEEIRDGLYARVDPESLKIVGFEILGFRRHYLKAHPEYRPHFEALFERAPMLTRDIPPKGYQRKQAEDALRDLAPALG